MRGWNFPMRHIIIPMLVVFPILNLMKVMDTTTPSQCVPPAQTYIAFASLHHFLMKTVTSHFMSTLVFTWALILWDNHGSTSLPHIYFVRHVSLWFFIFNTLEVAIMRRIKDKIKTPCCKIHQHLLHFNNIKYFHL